MYNVASFAPSQYFLALLFLWWKKWADPRASDVVFHSPGIVRGRHFPNYVVAWMDEKEG